MTPSHEHSTIDAAKRGFDRIYSDYAEDVYRFSFYLMQHREEADDLYQEVWLRVAKHSVKLAGIRDHKRWLFTITANCHRDWLRKKKLQRLLFNTKGLDDEVLEIHGCQQPEDVAGNLDLVEAIAKLPPRQKQIFILKEIEGYKLREIAEMLNINIGTVKSMAHMAVSRLRRELTAAELWLRKVEVKL
ncbi:RNA polymerase sigma factor [bacterium]|nr:RNA polymerase sigma factor [bacterium]